jgi:hypothetical protein
LVCKANNNNIIFCHQLQPFFFGEPDQVSLVGMMMSQKKPAQEFSQLSLPLQMPEAKVVG